MKKLHFNGKEMTDDWVFDDLFVDGNTYRYDASKKQHCVLGYVNDVPTEVTWVEDKSLMIILVYGNMRYNAVKQTILDLFADGPVCVSIEIKKSVIPVMFVTFYEKDTE